MHKKLPCLISAVMLALVASTLSARESRRPNIIIILVDDMGIDSVSAFNDKLGFKTLRLDAFAKEGMSFSDAHSGSSVCSPTRYGLLTGRYAWRTRLKQGVVPRWDKPLIARDRLTLGGMLKTQGYNTACIGKWHLGWNWPLTSEENVPIGDDTLFIVTCDNGTSLGHAKGANVQVNVRGGKLDIFEGGHRVPFIIRWPGHVRAGSTSASTICLTDVMATVAQIVGHQLPENSAEDSFGLLPAFDGRPLTREPVVHTSHTGDFAIRSGDWKLILCPGSGGKREVPNVENLPKLQLYNLADDPREQRNVAAENPEIVSRLNKELRTIISNGRSTPGKGVEKKAGL